MRVGVMMAGLLKKLLQTKQNVDSLSEEEIVDVDTTVAKEGGKEPKRRSQRGRKKVVRKGESRLGSKSSSAKGGQSKTSQLSSKNGERKRTRVQGRKTNKTSSKSKSMGSK